MVETTSINVNHWHMLAWRSFVGLVCIVACLVSGVLYAWAAYSRDLRHHFEWSLAEVTTVNTCGVFGDSVMIVAIGLLMNQAGPVVTTINVLLFLSGSYFGLYMQAIAGNPSVILAGILYAFNGLGGGGFYLVAMFTITTSWPKNLTGLSISVVEIAWSLSAAFASKLHPMVASISEFYLCLAWATLITSLFMLCIHVKWDLLYKRFFSVAVELDEQDSASSPQEEITRSITDSKALRRGSVGYGATEKNSAQSFRRRGSYLADDFMTGRQDEHDFYAIFGITPDIDELVAKYPNMSISGAVKKLEFGILLASMLCAFSTSSTMVAQLATVQDAIGETAWKTGDLIMMIQVARVIGKMTGGTICDMTAHSKIFTEPFLHGVALVFLLCTYALLGTGRLGESGLVGILVVNAFAFGFAVVVMMALLKHAFGARMLGVLISLSWTFFFLGYSFWNFIFVEVYSPEGSLKFLNMWLAVSCSCLIPLALTVWAWVPDLRQAVK